MEIHRGKPGQVANGRIVSINRSHMGYACGGRCTIASMTGKGDREGRPYAEEKQKPSGTIERFSLAGSNILYDLTLTFLNNDIDTVISLFIISHCSFLLRFAIFHDLTSNIY